MRIKEYYLSCNNKEEEDKEKQNYKRSNINSTQHRSLIVKYICTYMILVLLVCGGQSSIPFIHNSWIIQFKMRHPHHTQALIHHSYNMFEVLTECIREYLWSWKVEIKKKKWYRIDNLHSYKSFSTLSINLVIDAFCQPLKKFISLVEIQFIKLYSKKN